MSMRPRLVEEGTSIFPTDTTGKDRDDGHRSHLNFLDEQLNLASTTSGTNAQRRQGKEDRSLSSPFTSSSSSSLSRSSSLRKASRTKKPPNSILQFEISKKRGNRMDECTHENVHPVNMDLSYPSTIHQTHSNGNSAMETEEDTRIDSRAFFTPERESSQVSHSKHRLSTSFVVGGQTPDRQQDVTGNVTRMEIDDILPKPPLIVVDGANLAYAYAKAVGVLNGENSSLRNSSGGVEPDVRGIRVCASYFVNAGCRVQVVLPVHWMRKKPRADDRDRNGNAQMITPQVDILQDLEYNNVLCCSPPADDDDAYVIAMARREDGRARRKNLHYTSSSVQGNNISSAGGAFVLSNDFFRDAIGRDLSGELKYWLEGKHHRNNDLPPCPPGRISYSFCNLGSINQYGDPQLDFMPNPRHVLIEAIEKINRTNEFSQG